MLLVIGEPHNIMALTPVKISYALSFERSKWFLLLARWSILMYCTRERRWRKRIELDITTETLICEPIEKHQREFSCLNINDQPYILKRCLKSSEPSRIVSQGEPKVRLCHCPKK